MTTPSPTQQIADDIHALQTRIGWLQDSVRLAKARDAVEDLQTNVNGMGQRIANLRARLRLREGPRSPGPVVRGRVGDAVPEPASADQHAVHRADERPAPDRDADAATDRVCLQPGRGARHP